MTDPTSQLDVIIDVLGRLGILVRRERLGGQGGGLCTVRGRRVLFVDDDADLVTQLTPCLAALVSTPEVDEVYLIPVLRQQVERLRAARS